MLSWHLSVVFVQTLAMQTADAANSPFIIANDPDADRMAIAEKLPK